MSHARQTGGNLPDLSPTTEQAQLHMCPLPPGRHRSSVLPPTLPKAHPGERRSPNRARRGASVWA